VLARLDGMGENSGEHSKRSLTALMVALIWAVHPIHHPALAYIAGRADSLSTMFSLGAWLLYLHAREWHSVRTRVAGLLVVLLLAVLALGSKEIAITWMTLFLVWALFFDLEANRRDKVRAVTCVFAALLVYTLIRELPEARHAAPGPAGEPFPERLILVFRALGDYSRVLFLPAELHMERTILGNAPLASWDGFFDRGGLAPIGLCMAALVTVFCLWKVRGRKVRILGAVWFLIGFLPISNLIPLNATVAEHWIYMASVGAILFVAGCMLALPPRFYRVGGVAVGVVIVGFSIRTAFKVCDWTSNERLFSQTIEATGGSARMNMNLAVVHLKKGELDAAETILRDALQRFPDADPIRIKLASVLVKLGKNSEAESLLNDRPKAGKTPPAEHVAMWNEPIIRARLRIAEGNADGAIEILELAEERFPHIWAVYAIHAQILNETSGPNAAIALVENFTEAHWWSYPGHMLLGRLQMKVGDIPGAIMAFYKASVLDIHAAEPWMAIAEIHSARRDTEAMKAALGEAISRDPTAVKATGFLNALTDKVAAVEAQK